MNKKSRSIFYTFLALGGVFCIEVIYLQSTKSMNTRILNSKIAFNTLVGLPDLAISTEATYVRHRSMSSLFSIYKDDATLREYFPSTFSYAHSNIINKKSLDAN